MLYILLECCSTCFYYNYSFLSDGICHIASTLKTNGQHKHIWWCQHQPYFPINNLYSDSIRPTCQCVDKQNCTVIQSLLRLWPMANIIIADNLKFILISTDQLGEWSSHPVNLLVTFVSGCLFCTLIFFWLKTRCYLQWFEAKSYHRDTPNPQLICSWDMSRSRRVVGSRLRGCHVVTGSFIPKKWEPDRTWRLYVWVML